MLEAIHCITTLEEARYSYQFNQNYNTIIEFDEIKYVISDDDMICLQRTISCLSKALSNSSAFSCTHSINSFITLLIETVIKAVILNKSDMLERNQKTQGHAVADLLFNYNSLDPSSFMSFGIPNMGQGNQPQHLSGYSKNPIIWNLDTIMNRWMDDMMKITKIMVGSFSMKISFLKEQLQPIISLNSLISSVPHKVRCKTAGIVLKSSITQIKKLDV